MRADYDAVVVGAGPNGLAAAVTLARAGRSVLVLEGASQIGGGTRTEPLTLPGFRHDVCASIHPSALASPFFAQLPLAEHGLEWIHPDFPVAHPLPDEPAVLQHRSVTLTAETLGRDGPAYARLVGPLVAAWDRMDREVLGPASLLPRDPLAMLRLAWHGLRSARGLVSGWHTRRARALLAGHSAHSVLPLDRVPSAAPALGLAAMAHRVGFPLARGGSQAIAAALASYLASLGGVLQVDSPVTSLVQLPRSRVTLLDVTPRQLLSICGEALPPGYRDRLARFRYGPGVFKVDYALSAPVPWADPAVARAATVHLGGTFEEIEASELAPWQGRTAERPFLLCAQTSLFDPERAPAGKHTFWTYCHVPANSRVDMTNAIEDQLERFAPGFREVVLSRHVMDCAALEAHNPNCVGGDILGGSMELSQLFTRPLPTLSPYSTPLPGVYLCSASTPPGGGVHGMCGYHAAQAALRRWL